MENYIKNCVMYTIDTEHENFAEWIKEETDNPQIVLNAMDQNDLDNLITVIEKNVNNPDDHIYYHALKACQENKFAKSI